MTDLLGMYITNVEREGAFLKFWGQTDKKAALDVELALFKAYVMYEQGNHILTPSNIMIGVLCCAKYIDEKYYRARITNNDTRSQGTVEVNFIDFGNRDIVPISNLRSIECFNATFIALPPLALPFILSEVICIGGEWNDLTLEHISRQVRYMEVNYTIVSTHMGYNIIKIFIDDKDLASHLVINQLMQSISLENQESLLTKMIPRAPQVMPPPDQSLLQYKSVTLEPNSQHEVYVSYITDGPCHFSVQLKKSEASLAQLMREINSIPLKPFEELPIPGTVCLAKCMEDSHICRAVITSEVDNQYKLFYVDFGNTEIVPPDNIYQMPFKYIIPKIMAIRLSLEGIDKSTVTLEMQCAFKQFVDNRLLMMEVFPSAKKLCLPKCRMWDPETNTDVMDILNKAAQLAFPNVIALHRGFTRPVKVTFVYSCSKFYIHLKSNEDELNHLMANLQVYCNSTSSLYLNDPKLGLPCCAQFAYDGQWYRSLIVSLHEDSAKVKYIDYGNEEDIPIQSLKTIEGQFLTCMRPQAIECCLNGYQNMTEDSDRDNKLEELILDQEFTMKVIDIIKNKSLVELIDVNGSSVTALLMEAMISQTKVQVVANDNFENTTRTYGTVNSGMNNGSSRDQESWPQRDKSQNRMDKSESWRQNSRKQNGFVPNENNESWRHEKEWHDNTSNDSFKRGKRNNESRRSPSTNLRYDGKHKNIRKGNRGQNNTWNSPEQDRSFHNQNSNSDSLENSHSQNNHYERNGKEDNRGYNKTPRQDNSGFGNKDNGYNRNKSRNFNDNWNTDNSSKTFGDNEEYQGVKKKTRNFNGDDRNRSRNDTEEWGNKKNSYNENDYSEKKTYRDKNTYDNTDSRNKSRNDNEEWGNKKNSYNENDYSEKKTYRDKNTYDNTDNRNKSRNDNEEWGNKKNSYNQNDYSEKKSYRDKNAYDSDSSFKKGRQDRSFDNKNKYSDRGEYKKKSFRDNEFHASDHEQTDGKKFNSRNESKWSNKNSTNQTYNNSYQNAAPAINAAPDNATFQTIDVTGCLKVTLSWFHNPCSFFCQLMESQQSFSSLMEEIQEFYKNQPASDCIEGAPAIALFPEDNVFYRSRILKNIGNQYKVYYIDFGNISVVDKVWPIDKKFMELPIQAIPCGLGGIQPVGNEWPDPTAFTNYMQKDCLDCEFLRYEVDRYMVNLYSDNQDIKQQLIQDNVVKCIEPFVPPQEFDINFLSGHTFRAMIEFVNDLSDFTMTLNSGIQLMCSAHNLATATERFDAELKQKQGEVVIVYCDNIIENRLEVTLYDHAGNKLNILNPDEGAYESIDPVCPYLLVQSKVNGVVSVVNETSIYIQPSECAERLEELLNEIFEHYNSLPQEDPLIPEEGYLYAVCSQDSNWYRGRVTCFDDEKVTVLYVDYGNTEDVTFGSLRELDPKFYWWDLMTILVHLNVPTADLLEKQVTVQVHYGENGLEGEILQVDDGFVPTEPQPVENACPITENIQKEPQAEQELCQNAVDELQEGFAQMQTVDNIGESTAVVLSHIDSPSDFYIQLADSQDAIGELQSKLQERIGEMPVLENVSIGGLCAAPYSVDQMWYRSQILDADEDITTVRFIDYGNTDVIDNKATQIKTLPAELLALEEYATRCRLKIRPVEEEWSKASTDRFEELAYSENVRVQFVNQDEKANYVELLSNCQNVKDILIAENLAVIDEDLVLDPKLKGYISHMNSPSEFWVQLDGWCAELEWIAEQLSNAASFPDLEDFTPGSLCAAMFPDDEMWYRARILSNTVAGLEVLFLDYGNSCVCSCLKQLPEHLVMASPLALKCSLQKPEGVANWSPEAAQRFSALSADGQTEFTLKKLTTDETSIVELYVNDEPVSEKISKPGMETMEMKTESSGLDKVPGTDLDESNDLNKPRATCEIEPEVPKESNTQQVEDIHNLTQENIAEEPSNDTSSEVKDTHVSSPEIDGIPQSKEIHDVLKTESKINKDQDTFKQSEETRGVSLEISECSEIPMSSEIHESVEAVSETEEHQDICKVSEEKNSEVFDDKQATHGTSLEVSECVDISQSKEVHELLETESELKEQKDIFKQPEEENSESNHIPRSEEVHELLETESELEEQKDIFKQPEEENSESNYIPRSEEVHELLETESELKEQKDIFKQPEEENSECNHIPRSEEVPELFETEKEIEEQDVCKLSDESNSELCDNKQTETYGGCLQESSETCDVLQSKEAQKELEANETHNNETPQTKEIPGMPSCDTSIEKEDIIEKTEIISEICDNLLTETFNQVTEEKKTPEKNPEISQSKENDLVQNASRVSDDSNEKPMKVCDTEDIHVETSEECDNTLQEIAENCDKLDTKECIPTEVCDLQENIENTETLEKEPSEVCDLQQNIENTETLENEPSEVCDTLQVELQKADRSAEGQNSQVRSNNETKSPITTKVEFSEKIMTTFLTPTVSEKESIRKISPTKVIPKLQEDSGNTAEEDTIKPQE